MSRDGTPAIGQVLAVHRSADHRFSKDVEPSIRLLEGLGVEGDAHCGATVQHRSRVKQDPTQPNLRQVHLIASELFVELADEGYVVRPGDLGENVTTTGIDLLGLPTGARLALGADALVEVTGLRNPCGQIDAFRAGLRSKVLERGADGHLVRKAGVMGIVVSGGIVAAGATVAVELPAGPHVPLERV